MIHNIYNTVMPKCDKNIVRYLSCDSGEIHQPNAGLPRTSQPYTTLLIITTVGQPRVGTKLHPKARNLGSG